MKRHFWHTYWMMIVIGIGNGVHFVHAQDTAPSRPESRPARQRVVGGAELNQQRQREQQQAADAERAAHQPAAVEALSDKAKDTIALTLWTVTLSDTTEQGADKSSVKLPDALSNLPTAFTSLDHARSLISRLKNAGLVRSAREFRLLTLDGQAAQVQIGANRPRATATTMTNMGRSNTITYEAIGTLIEALPRIDSEKQIQVQFSYNVSDIEKSKDVAMMLPADGNPTFADVVVTHQLKTATRLKNGTATLLQSSAKSGSSDGPSAAEAQLIILGAQLLTSPE